MELKQVDRGIEVATSRYRLLLHREGGYCIREVEIEGVGRLDRFDRPGEGPHPTCMYFDNCTVNYAFQQGYYGKDNLAVEAVIEGSTVTLTGALIPIIDDAQGTVTIEKRMRFLNDAYDVDLRIRFDGVGAIDFLSLWWDVNDKWLRAMRSSAGMFLPLTVGVGDCFDETLPLSWRPMRAMDRGTGRWMEMIGERASILCALNSASEEVFSAGGMKYWDGPNDADAGEGVSHGCINFDLINCELSGSAPLSIPRIEVSYRVFLSGPTIF